MRKNNPLPPFELDEQFLKKAVAFGSVAALSSLPSVELLAADESSNEIEEIIVTASKRSEKIEDLPMSVQAIMGTRLDDAGINDFMDYAELIPTLSYIQYGPGRSAFYLRGTSDGNFGNIAGPNTTVSLYIDESPITAVGLNPDLHVYDMERIEVLNGPQGTLYGSSSQGGTIRLITNKPQRTEFDVGIEVDASGGSKVDTGDSVEGFINIPISDNIAARIVGYSVTESGFIDLVGGTKTFSASNFSVPLHEKEDSNESTSEGFRASVRAWLNDNLTATLTHISQETNTEGSWDHQPGAIGDLKSSKVVAEFTDDEWDQTSLTLEGSFHDASFTYAGTFFDREVRYLWDYNDYVEYYSLDSPSMNGFGYYSYYTCDYYSYYYYGTFDCNNPTMWADYSVKQDRETHEFRISGGTEDDGLQWLLGVFYDKVENPYKYTYLWPGLQSYYLTNTWNGGGNLGNSRAGIWWDLDNIRKDDKRAVYGELIFTLDDKTKLTLGLRRFESEMSFQARDGYFGGFGEAFYGRDTFVVEDDSGLAPKLAFSRELDNGGMIYLNYSQGYRPAGTNRINARSEAAPLTYDEDRLDNIEVGYKYASSDGTLRHNTAFYSMKWDDMQSANFDLDLAPIQFNSNIGDAVIQGIESDITILTDGFTIIAGFALTDPKLDEDYLLDGALLAKRGSVLANVPRFKSSLAINKTFDLNLLGNFGGLKSGSWDFNVSRTGERKSSITNPINQGAYSLANFSLALRGDHFTTIFYIDNLFDERPVIWEYSGYRPETIFTSRPRVAGLRIKYRL